MTQSNKKGFARLYDLEEAKQKEKRDSPPLPTTPHDSPPVTTSPRPQSPPAAKPPAQTAAPAGDFNRRANSLDREALPAGLFPGSSKKIYDALYLRSRGAHPPRKTVRAARRDFLEWTDIRNIKTVDGHLRYLMGVGLIVRNWELGATEGSEYEVRLPEELPRLTTTHHHSPGLTPPQLSGSGNSQLSGSGGEGQAAETAGGYGAGKTVLKTNTERDDDEAFARLLSRLRQASKEITGREPSAADAERWEQLGELLVTELKIAAGRTTVSNVPAFLTEHLRRRLWKKEKRQLDAEDASEGSQARAAAYSGDISKCPDCFGAGMWYPEGFERGVAKCTHQKLTGG